MSTATAAPTATDEEYRERSWDLLMRVQRDIIERGDAYADMPQGGMLKIVPDDDPDHAAWVIEQGTKAVRQGKNVYFRHVRVAELPEPYQPSEEVPVAVRSIHYNPDGSVQRVCARSEDGEWREVEPTPEDAAGLPPADWPRANQASQESDEGPGRR